MKKIKLIFVAFGSLGDIYPLISIAREMNKNHDVIFLTNEYFKNIVKSAGLTFFQMGDIDEQLAALESKSSTGETNEGKIHRFENIIGKNFERAFSYIEKLVRDGEQLIVVSHGNLSPAVPACEKFNIPLILTYYAPSQIPYNAEDTILYLTMQGKKEFYARHIYLPVIKFLSRLSFDIKPAYNEYRKKFDLPPIRNMFEKIFDLLRLKKYPHTQLFTPLEIGLIPYWFCEPINKKMESIKFVGFPFYDERQEADETVIEEFIRSHGKPIIFTPGTAVEDVEQFCSEIIPICRKLGSPGIFASKHGQAAFEKLNKPGDVPLLFLKHADFSFLLPKSRCLIHHGGIGTIAQAVRARIPQIVRPRMYDQPVNGLRVMMNGLGGCLSPQAFNAESVAGILLHIESNGKIQEMLSYYSDLVNSENAVTNAAKLIDEYVQSEIVKNVESTANSPAYTI